MKNALIVLVVIPFLTSAAIARTCKEGQTVTFAKDVTTVRLQKITAGTPAVIKKIEPDVSGRSFYVTFLAFEAVPAPVYGSGGTINSCQASIQTKQHLVPVVTWNDGFLSECNFYR